MSSSSPEEKGSPSQLQPQSSTSPNEKQQSSEVHVGEPCAPRRRNGPFYPVLMEVAGGMDDEIVRDVTQRLRKYHNRYAPLLRCMFTLVATTLPEQQLFGDASPGESVDGGVSTRPAPLFTAPKYAVSANRTLPLVNRLYPSALSQTAPSYLPQNNGGVSAMALASANHPRDTATRVPPSFLTWLDAALPAAVDDVAAVGCHQRAVRQLEDFMAYHFLPLAMLHNVPEALLHSFPASSTPASGASAAQIGNSIDEDVTGGDAGASASALTNTFVLRHYVNEASRNASFLFADPFHPPASRVGELHGSPAALPAVLVDPRAEQLDAYLSDLARLKATLSCVVFTHCYVDGDAGLSPLLSRFPAARVVSGVPLSPAGTAQDIPISTFLRLRTVRLPAFSPECLLVEVYAANLLVGICSGVLWGTDAGPRADLLEWASYPNSQAATTASPSISAESSAVLSQTAAAAVPRVGSRGAALSHTFQVLHRHFFDPYLATLCEDAPSQPGARRSGGATVPKSARDEGANEEEQPQPPQQQLNALETVVEAMQRVVLLPTHGGYSNVTNQLDLYWGAHLGDLVRMKHSRTVVDTLAVSEAEFVKYNKRLPPLPHPPLFDACRVWHLRQLLRRLDPEERRQAVAQLSAGMQSALQHSFDPYASEAAQSASGASTSYPQPLSSYVNVVDAREAKDYHALHMSGAVLVPMSFPGVAYGARRAELWLQCLLVPHQPILALCGPAAQRAEVHRRLASLSPGCTVAVIAMEDLPHLVSVAASETNDRTAGVPVPWREIHCSRPSELPADVPVPMDLTWVQHAEALVRLTSYEHLVAIEPINTRVVLDVRTPYEFKNGSHQHSVHVELSEMCMMAVADAMQAAPPLVSGRHPKDSSAADRPSNAAVAPWFVGSSSKLADVYMEKIHTTALVANLPVVREETQLSDIVIYCAGGYRSLIAASLMQRAMETSTNPAWRRLHIADVSGGAFQIMTQRPDLWRVKDRSIICIS